MKIFAKIMAVPAIAGLKTAGIIIEILAKASCILVVAGACIGLYLLIGMLLGAIDIAGRKLSQLIRS